MISNRFDIWLLSAHSIADCIVLDDIRSGPVKIVCHTQKHKIGIELWFFYEKIWFSKKESSLNEHYVHNFDATILTPCSRRKQINPRSNQKVSSNLQKLSWRTSMQKFQILTHLEVEHRHWRIRTSSWLPVCLTPIS